MALITGLHCISSFLPLPNPQNALFDGMLYLIFRSTVMGNALFFAQLGHVDMGVVKFIFGKVSI